MSWHPCWQVWNSPRHLSMGGPTLQTCIFWSHVPMSQVCLLVRHVCSDHVWRYHMRVSFPDVSALTWVVSLLTQSIMADWQPFWLTWVTLLHFIYFMLSWSDQCHFIGPALHRDLRTWSLDDMKSGWHVSRMSKPGCCTPDHHLSYQNGLYWSVHKRTFQSPPLISSLCSPLPPYTNLCPHWDVEMDLETWVPHLPREMGFETIIPLPPDRWQLQRNHFPLHQQLPLWYWLL